MFGCTDDNAGRLVLSRVATYLLAPVIDVGVLLTSDTEDKLTGIDGRVTILSPESACLVCRDRIDLARAAVNSVRPKNASDSKMKVMRLRWVESNRRWWPLLQRSRPQRSTNFWNDLLAMVRDRGPGEILCGLHEREISTNSALLDQGIIATPTSGKLGDDRDSLSRGGLAACMKITFVAVVGSTPVAECVGLVESADEFRISCRGTARYGWLGQNDRNGSDLIVHAGVAIGFYLNLDPLPQDQFGKCRFRVKDRLSDSTRV